MKHPKTPEDISSDYLRQAALEYAQQRETTETAIRRMLFRRISRKCFGTDSDPESFSDMIDDALAHASRSSLVDDSRYAERAVELAQDKGESCRKLVMKLQEKGIDAATIELVTRDYDDFAAAESFARKKGLGQFRSESSPETRKRDFGKLARRGFSYDVCSSLIEDVDET